MASSRKNPLPDLAKRVEPILARYLASTVPTRFCVGFSGGLDSVVLLHLRAGFCSRTGHALQAIHVHHGLSPNADAWADFSRKLAMGLGVTCVVERVSVKRRDMLGLEAAARHARYAVYAQMDCDVLLLAQHLDDQAETLLLNLLRGSGVRGLAAMPECRVLRGQLKLVRPLLDISRADLLEYALSNGLSWVEDESNADQSFDRNFLRHGVMPRLTKRFPSAADTLARTARHAAETDALLLEVAQDDLARCVEADGFCLNAASFLSEPRLRNVLRCWLQRKGIVADTRAFDVLLRMMRDARADASPCWVWRDHAVRKYRDRLFVTPAQLRQGSAQEFTWQGGAVTSVATWSGALHWQKMSSVGISEQALHGRLMLRPRVGGEGIRLAPGGPTRKLKHLFQEAGVPPWTRETLPLLWIDDQLAAVPGLWIAAEFFQEGGWQPIWCDFAVADTREAGLA